ncbi:MAG: hypothetical protein RL154_60 [Pseudomonadota bacterium]|jgi:succinate dehydrogenase / fumarate reductase cytochrome b subunit
MNKYALFTGCTARTTAPELLKSTMAVADALGIELVLLNEASCCGATHLQDYNEFMALVINARNIVYAEKLGVDMLTICNTCQLVLSQVNEKLKKDEVLKAKVNAKLAEVGLEFKGTINVRHFLNVLIEDYGVENLSSKVTKSFTGFNIAPFYGCHNIGQNGVQDNLKQESLELIIEAIGANSVDYVGKNRCCGFHADLQAPKTAYALTGNILADAVDQNADIVVTPCPLCHYNMDALQKNAAKAVGREFSIPTLHLPQMIGLALGLEPALLGFNHNITPVKFL